MTCRILRGPATSFA